MTTIYVNPALGEDRGEGSQSAPLKTLTEALSQATPGTRIQLEVGTYNAATGERFPLKIPSGVTVVGNESGKGSGILIEGSGDYLSASATPQRITLLLENQAELRGVTLTNSEISSTGIWLESVTATVAYCTLIHNKGKGIYATGSGSPQILNNLFIDNEGYGIFIENTVTGEVQGNLFQNTGYGLVIQDDAAPQISDNAIFENRSGVLISGDAKPILRRNTIERNSSDGMVIAENAAPNLGSSQDPGRNTFGKNGGFDVQNTSRVAIASFGNHVNGNRIQGNFNVVAQNFTTASVMTLYVNSTTGNDSNTGTQSSPFKTITKALSQAQAGTVVQVAPGTYTATRGESFPLFIRSGVKLVGNEAGKGSNTQITGSGRFTSPTAAAQNVTVWMENNSALHGFSVTNEEIRGTAVWIESVYCTVSKCTFAKSKREGVYITGTGIPEILDSVFTENGGNGIALAGNAKGEIRGNKFQNTGYAIAVQAQAAPLIVDNEITGNRTGIVLSGSSKPVLRKNLVEKNLQDGLTVIADSKPDLGTSQDPGGNVFRDNGKYDVQNASKFKLISVGNQINLTRTKGEIDLSGVVIPPTPGPTPTPTPTPDGSLKDIAGHWAEAFIKGLVSLNIISGYPDGTFRPDNSLSRAEHAALLAKAFDLTPIRPATSFKDVASDFWAKAVIEKANRAGFLAGFPDGTFRANQNLTRAQAIVSLVNGLKFTGGTSNSLLAYSDRAQIPSYATDAVATATEKRMVVNYPSRNSLSPQRDITRGEVAAIFYQTLVAQGRVQRIDSPYIV
ncbi:MAG: DUF1565 domain-containing protein [Lyngbya sp.]|nr:DUF1565 domain-containing protein [Lyngbya sp.]